MQNTDNIREILDELGKIILTFPSDDIEIINEENDNLKTNIDQIAHNHIIDKLRAVNSLPIISEEDSISILGPRPDKYWIIDPIDGTRSLLNGYHTYVSQVALIENQTPILSVVYEPALNNFYHCIKGQGAYKNDVLLGANLVDRPKTIIDNYPVPIPFIRNLIEKTSLDTYLECGSIALKMCRVADQGADVFVKRTRVFDWDIAPATLIIQEMGGVVQTLSGSQILFEGNMKKNDLLVSGNEAIHQYTLNKLNETK